MSPRHRILFVPALDDALLDGGAMPQLQRAAAQAQRAELVLSGLDLPVCLLANVLWGCAPDRHGVTLVASDDPSPLQRALAERVAWLRGLDEQSEAPLQLCVEASLLRVSLAGEDRLDCARTLDAALADWLRGAHAVSWIVGGCVPEATRAQLPCPSGAQCVGAIAEWLEEPTAEECDRLLRTPGIERVLRGEALAAWGLPRPIAIAERGYSFESGAAHLGHPDRASDRPAPLLCSAPPPARGWPRSVHDLRIAPTVAKALGVHDLDFEANALN